MIGTENLEEKLSQVLNDPNSMAQLMSFAQSLGMRPPDAPPPPGPPPGPSPGPPPGDEAFVRGILQLVRQANQKDGPQEALLAALKPYLRPERREKLDRAMRIARIATGKKRVIKIGGAYHGWSDQVVYGLKIPGSRALLESHGIPGGCYEATDEVRPNDLEMLEEMLKRNRLLGGTAAVLVEPVGPESGTRPVAHDYNAGVRALCDKYGALMVFDEVVTGFRVALSGAQGYFGVVPDLTVFGKIVAGGYPAAGGVGGKKEYAQLMAAGLATGKHRAYVGGTLAANPLSCLAGYTAIREIERTNACEIAGRMGDRLCDGLKGLLAQYGLPFVAYNQGSIVHLECTGAMSFDFSSMSFAKSAMGLLKHKDMMYVRKDSMERMGAAYMANGIVTLAGSRLYTSMADTPEIIDDALNRFEEVFKHVQKTNKGML